MDRSRYSFRELRKLVVVKDNNDYFVESEELAEAGFILEPFWDKPGDLEGESYSLYKRINPDFGISMRKRVFDKLCLSVQFLPANWKIVIKAAFRPLVVQDKILDSFISKSRMSNLGWTEDQHLEYARTFVADPRIVYPPHVTGGAVDIDIKDIAKNDYIDMGCPPNTDGEIAFLHSDLLRPDQYSNRMILLEAMLKAGFAPNVYEWWHYQYGETYWAAFYGHSETLYSIVNE